MGMIGNLLRVSQAELDAILKDSSLLEKKIYDETASADDLLDVDKSWEGIYYLLTGHVIAEYDLATPPLSLALLSGQIVDDEQDLGYGPAHYITADQVKEVNKALEGISRDSLEKKYDGKKMNDEGIYPEGWEEAESLEYLLDNFEGMKIFYKAAEKKNMAVISFIN